MAYNIEVNPDTFETIIKFEDVVDNLFDNIKNVIPEDELKNSQIIYEDDYGLIESSWDLFDLFITIQNKILPALKNIKRVETKKDTEKIIF